jgi:SAM-dependent methyltransferase
MRHANGDERGVGNTWQRFTGRGMYPVEYARWLLNPLRYLIMPPSRIVDRLQLLPTDRVLEIGCGPGFFSPVIARRLSGGQLTLFDAQAPMLEMALQRLQKQQLANFTGICGSADSLPFSDSAFDLVLLITAGRARLPSWRLPDRTPRQVRASRDPGFLVLRSTKNVHRAETELDELAALAGLAKRESWSGLLVQTFNYNKPARLAA